jgi:thiol peroxidase
MGLQQAIGLFNQIRGAAMKSSSLMSLIITGLLGVGSVSVYAAGEEVQAIKVATESASSGDGNTVKLMGNDMPLSGQALKVGDPLPAAIVVGGNLAPVNIAEAKGRVRIISVVPSVDTPTCEAQTHQLSEKDRKLAEKVDMITISMDLPFAQQRFAKEAKIKNVTFYSDYNSAQFGKNNGLLMEPLRLLARAVIVTDKDNVVRYIQVVPEVTQLPDMPAAMNFAKTLL